MAIKLIQLAIALIILITILILMIKKKSNASVSLIWIGISFVVVLFAVWPNVLNVVSAWLKIDYPPMLAVSLVLITMIGIVFYLSTEIAVLQTKIRELSIHISILNHEVHDLKTKNNNKEKEIEE